MMPEAAPDPFAGLTGHYFHAESLWSFAKKLAERFEKSEREEDASRTPAGLSVILFAAMTVETFINELTELAAQEGRRDDRMKALADALEEIEESRGSIRLKFLTVGLALGTPIRKGEEPYQSFNLLFKVRDAVVHLRPYRHTFTETGVEAEPRRLLDELHRQRKLISDPTSRPAQSFLSMIATSALCYWSVNTASAAVSHVVKLLPEGDFKKRVTVHVADVIGADRAELFAESREGSDGAPRAVGESGPKAPDTFE